MLTEIINKMEIHEESFSHKRVQSSFFFFFAASGVIHCWLLEKNANLNNVRQRFSKNKYFTRTII